MDDEHGMDAREDLPQYHCSDAVWIGPWKTVADAIGIYDWRVWIAVTAAVSARAHRNIHVNYHGDLYGMGAWLLVAPSGTGKSIVPQIAKRLLPPGYNTFSSVESGQALAEMLATIERDATGKIGLTTALPSLLTLSEWSQLVTATEFHNSSLLERIHEAIDGEPRLDLNRADKKGNGKIHIDNPTLTILGTTTTDFYRQVTTERKIRSGFINRHFILPCAHREWLYNDDRPMPRFDKLAEVEQGLPLGYALGNGESVRDCYSAEAYAYDHDFGKQFLEPFRKATFPAELEALFTRLHVYQRRISLLYAWATRSRYILLEHVQAAEAAVRTSYQFLLAMHEAREIEVPSHMRARGEIEERVMKRIATRPDQSREQICQALKGKTVGYSEISTAIKRLVEANAIAQHSGNGRGNKTTLTIVTPS